MSAKIAKPTRRSFVKGTAVATAAAVTGFPLIGKAAEAEHVLRIGTLAPKGSSWEKAFSALGRKVKEDTDGAVQIKIYPGGQMGDEPAMVRKIRTGQLDGAAVTNVGLGEINPQVLMLQLPLLFRNYEQLDKVRAAMADKFEAALKEKGFQMRGRWGDVGFAHLFSNTPVKVPDDVKACKMWVWDTDKVSNTVMQVTGVNAVPLSVPDVRASLETGLIDAFLNSPYGAIALQWYTKVKYVTDLKLAMTVGGSVMSTASWDKLSQTQKDIIDGHAHTIHGALLKRIRQDNKDAMTALVSKGIEVVPPQDFPKWKAVADAVRDKLTGSFFDKVLVDEMMSLL